MMKSLRACRTVLLLPMALCLLGIDDCAYESGLTESLGGTSIDDESASLEGLTDAENAAVGLSDLVGDCAPSTWLLCGEAIAGNTSDPNSGSTDVLDHYELAIGNYEGPEIAYAFQATTTETVEWSLLDAVPTELNHDLFVFSNATGTCDVSQGIARGFNSVQFEAQAGQIYYLIIDGYDGDSGPFAAELSCTGGAVGGDLGSAEHGVQAAVNFSPQSYPQSHLNQTITALDAAEHSLDIAMYSYRDGGLRQAVERAQQRGVAIRAILESARHDRNDPEGSRGAELESWGIEVRYVNKVMHHKFVIIDGPRLDLDRAATGTLITGSGNWSWSAGTRYDENTLFLTGDEHAVLRMQAEFNLLWDQGRPFDWNEEITSIPHNAIEESDIPGPEGAEIAFTSNNFRISTTSYGPTFSSVAGSGAVREPLAEFILSADQSVWVASGHLRSRQITDALIAAHQANPSLEILVYLDGQEYKNESYFLDQVDDYEACVDDATTETQLLRCEDKGLHFGTLLATDHPGIELRFKYYAYRWHWSYAVQMHHKYIVVDEERVATGSYNFSNNAEHDTFENMFFLEGPTYETVIEDFVLNFQNIWNTGRLAPYEALLTQITETEADFPIVFDSMALYWEEIGALKAAILANCPEIDSIDYRDNPQNHPICER